jgi:integrase/recombinase XerD
MKIDRHGQATPLDFHGYKKIRAGFLLESHRSILDIAYYTGERWGAILQLQVSDVYQRPLSREIHKDITFRADTRKDKTTRACPVASDLGLRLQAYQPPLAGYLFPSPNIAGKYLSSRSADAALRRAIERAGMTGLGYSTHSTRRGFITRLSNAGIAIRVIQKITGHRSLSVLAAYIEVSDAQLRSAVEVA